MNGFGHTSFKFLPAGEFILGARKAPGAGLVLLPGFLFWAAAGRRGIWFMRCFAGVMRRFMGVMRQFTRFMRHFMGVMRRFMGVMRQSTRFMRHSLERICEFQRFIIQFQKFIIQFRWFIIQFQTFIIQFYWFIRQFMGWRLLGRNFG